MAQVLAIVPTAGIDAVLVAVELALETGRAQHLPHAQRRPDAPMFEVLTTPNAK